MTELDKRVIEKMLSSKEAMATAKEFIQKYQESLREPYADHQALQEKP